MAKLRWEETFTDKHSFIAVGKKYSYEVSEEGDAVKIELWSRDEKPVHPDASYSELNGLWLENTMRADSVKDAKVRCQEIENG
jgi:hypothetical protein